MRKLFYYSFLSFIFSQFIYSQELTPKQTSIAIYQNNYATIQQDVEFNVSTSPTSLLFVIPSTNVIPWSTFLRINGEILEQSFISSQKDEDSWQKDAIGKDVTIISPNGQSYRGKLMFFSDDELIISTEDKKTILVKDFEGFTFLFNDHPFFPAEKSKIIWLAKPAKTGKNTGNLVYHSSGFSWRGNYQLYVDEEKDKLDIYAFAMLRNQTEMNINDANLKIVEGDLNISEPGTIVQYESTTKNSAKMLLGRGGFEPEKEIFDYYKFTYPQKINLLKGETKLLTLFSSENISFNKTYSYFLYTYPMLFTKDRPTIRISFSNTKQNNLGRIFPKGQANIYIKQKDGLEFIGQNYIKTVPVGDKVEIDAGKVTDLAVEVTRADHVQLSNDLTERRFKVVCHNFKNKDATIEITYTEALEMELTQSNIKPKVKESNKLVFDVPIKANSSNELIISILVKQ